MVSVDVGSADVTKGDKVGVGAGVDGGIMEGLGIELSDGGKVEMIV